MSTTPVHQDEEKHLGFLHVDHNDPHHQHDYVGRARDRLRHFLHPSGKKIHIADSPQDAENLRKKLEQAMQSDDESYLQNFDIYVSGSPEHLNALREAHAHHEDRREELRTQHGEMYQRFADVHQQLDSLSEELDRVTTHGVSLEAHFSKFGYDAHIRTYDDESPSGSGTTTPRSSNSSLKESKCEKGYATSLKLFKVPVMRQYFHKGTLWRSAGAEEVQSFELFVDLLYVGIIAVNGDAASENPTGMSLLKFIITFTLSWKIWNDMALIISWFETDDIVQRVSILFLLACLFGYTTNISQAFESTYATLIGFYLCARLFMASYLVLVAVLVRMVRGVMIWHASVAVVAASIWIGSIHVSYPKQLILIWIAMGIDICAQVFYVFLINTTGKLGGRMKAFMDRNFEFWPAINIEHRTERTNAFVTLVFGYSVVALLYQSTRNGIDAHYGKGILGLTQAFCFNWMYFEIDGANLHVHAIRRSKWSSFAWVMAHLPFIMSYVLGSGALARLVLAIDTPDSHLEALAEAYQARAEPEVRMGIRWFYCAGFSIALVFMGLISLSHVHKEIVTLRFRKRYRLVGRFVVAIVILLLPLAGDRLDSLELVGIVTALLFISLAQELWGNSCCKEKLMERSKPCKYYGHCGKKELEELIKNGKQLDVDSAFGGEKAKKRHVGLSMCPT